MTKPYIMVAPNGARLNKTDHPKLPLTIEETVLEAKSCYEAGANAIHLHIRDEHGAHTLDANLYRKAIAALNKALPDMRIQITTEAVGMFSPSQQLHCLKEVAPDWASISIKEISNDLATAPHIYETCEKMDTKVQHILYDTDDAKLLKAWITQGIVKAHQTSVLLVLGRYAKNQISDPNDIEPFVEQLPSGAEWMLCAFGPSEHECLHKAALLGGNCRVGFENSRVNANANTWPDNAASVKALKKLL